MTFRDLFAPAASGYAAFRPHYPAALFGFLAARCPSRRLAWDCATGSGQAASDLAGHFDHVVATDASAAQLRQAARSPRVSYVLARAESIPFAAASVDLVTVAQALHWLDRAAFYREAKRVLAGSGVIAVWCYTLLEIEPAIDVCIREFYQGDLGPYWPPGRALVAAGYRTIEFPFDEFDVPAFAIQLDLTLSALAGYLRTWSATLQFTRDRGHDPVEPFMRRLAPVWGEPDRSRQARFPLHVRAGTTTGPGGGRST